MYQKESLCVEPQYKAEPLKWMWPDFIKDLLYLIILTYIAFQ